MTERRARQQSLYNTVHVAPVRCVGNAASIEAQRRETRLEAGQRLFQHSGVGGIAAVLAREQ